jgi:hypothetical protein
MNKLIITALAKVVIASTLVVGSTNAFASPEQQWELIFWRKNVGI